jgi:hypothetical protein
MACQECGGGFDVTLREAAIEWWERNCDRIGLSDLELKLASRVAALRAAHQPDHKSQVEIENANASTQEK